MNAVIKYPGAKWSLANWVISHFPPHHSYLEPFFGSGAVLFTKPRSSIETVNDLDSDIVNLFYWIREEPERLARLIRWTPYAREVYNRAFEKQYTETDSLRRAVDFCARMMQGHGFRTTGKKVGWKNDVQGRERAYAVKSWVDMPDTILQAAERLRDVQIEHTPAVELIRRFNFPNVLIYADPPYVLSSRSAGKKQYAHEMTDEDHIELLDALKSHQGPVLISGYASEMYDSELTGWYRENTTVTDQTSRVRQEVLWMNFEPSRQESLF
ncbi:MAG: DNA adenine methylase [Oscillospiraceae bacterium]|nr:DNA adenine methylase [Oscillospiraceae bacterium]